MLSGDNENEDDDDEEDSFVLKASSKSPVQTGV